MAMINQEEFDPIPMNIAGEHIACVLLLDTSDSMNANSNIDKLNQGLREFKQQVISDTALDQSQKESIDIAVITFGYPVREVVPFVPIVHFGPPTLSASGSTPLAEGLNLALDKVEERKNIYRQNGTPYKRPWIFCMTDGEPTDDDDVIEDAANRLKGAEAAKKVLGYCVGVEGYNKTKMSKIFEPRHMFKLQGANFVTMFEFLSNSITTNILSDPSVGDKVQVQLPQSVVIDI